MVGTISEEEEVIFMDDVYNKIWATTDEKTEIENEVKEFVEKLGKDISNYEKLQAALPVPMFSRLEAGELSSVMRDNLILRVLRTNASEQKIL